MFPFSRFLNIRSAYFASFRSDGRKLAFLSDLTGVPQVWQIDLEGSEEVVPWPDALTFETDRVLEVWYSPAAGDHRLLYSRDSGGNENAQLYLLGEDGSETALTAGFENCMHIMGEWSADGKTLLFAANRRDPALFDLYRLDLDSGEARLIWQNDRPGYLQGAAFSPDGQRVMVVRNNSSFDDDLLEIDLRTGQARSLNPGGYPTPLRILQPVYLTGGRAVLLITDAGADMLYLARLDLHSGALEKLYAPDWDVEYLALAPDGEHVACLVNEDGVSVLRLYSMATRIIRAAPPCSPTPGVIGAYFTDDGRMVFSPDGKRLAFSFSAAGHPSDLYLWDFDQDTVRPVTRAPGGGLPKNAFSAPQLVHYPTFDQRAIPAWLYRPTPRAGKTPVIVWVHGGPESQFRPFINPILQYFVHAGYAVLATNVRGSTGYGKAYSHLDDVRRRMDSVADLAHAALWLKSQAEFDGDRLVVYGGSYGGFMVLAALTHYPELWAAGVDIVGIGNFVTFLERTSSYRRVQREAEYGSLAEDRAFLAEISPFNHIERLSAPLIVLHGKNDPRVPFYEAEQMVAALRARNHPVQFLSFDDEGHGIVKLKNKLVAYPAVVDFLARHAG